MKKDVLERIMTLEREVKDLRIELHQLRQDQLLKPKKSEDTEPILRKYLALNKESPAAKPVAVKQVKEKPAKPKRSLEETFMWALPKVFMVILVLGVLWGLKLVSEYGYLSDSVKIMLSYVLSIGLGVYAFVMEHKGKLSSSVIIALYGGAFIVGILTTAAGAILYDVLGLYTALVIALVYIVYGVAISYRRGNEALTVLVVFTSLLLPYLLEYMDFSGVIIAVFIVLLFTAVQIVIVKHRQRKALYVGAVFSMLATTIVAGFNNQNELVFASSTVIVFCLFLFSFLRIYDAQSKVKNVHAGLLCGLAMLTIGIVKTSFYINDNTIILLVAILLLVLSSAAYQMKKQQKQELLDVLATVSVMAVLTIISHIPSTAQWDLLMYIVTAFAGLMLAFKLQVKLMKWVYGLIFAYLGFITIVENEVRPLLSVEHVTLLLVLALLIYLWFFIRRLPKHKVKEEETADFELPIRLEDGLAVIIYGAVLSYIYKLDVVYMTGYHLEYVFLLVIALLFIAVLYVKPAHIGPILPIVAGIVYAVVGFLVYIDQWNIIGEVPLAIALKLLYVGVLIVVLLNLWTKGRIYRNNALHITEAVEAIFVIGIVVILLAIFGLTDFMHTYSVIGWSVAVITNTVSIFVLASLSLLMATKRDYKNLKLTGIGLLFFGIVKMIFFDLSALDLLIRSVLFIGIGAVGLFVSNKLLGKK